MWQHVYSLLGRMEGRDIEVVTLDNRVGEMVEKAVAKKGLTSCRFFPMSNAPKEIRQADAVVFYADQDLGVDMDHRMAYLSKLATENDIRWWRMQPDLYDANADAIQAWAETHVEQRESE